MGYRRLERSCPKTGWLSDTPVRRVRFLVTEYQKARQTMQHLRHLLRFTLSVYAVQKKGAISVIGHVVRKLNSNLIPVPVIGHCLYDMWDGH